MQTSGDHIPLHALRRTGLQAKPDPAFDRFASIVQRTLGVPVALVSLVDDVQQVFPGACGLAEPWQQQRWTPLSHSFCQHVVTSGVPLVITDARTDPRAAGNLAVTELGVVGYAGMPLTDADGHLLGSLCAIDTSPRQWTTGELDLLADLAATCSDSLRLRIATVAAGDREGATGAAFDRSQLLLRASVALANTTTVADVVDIVRTLVTGTLDPDYVGVSPLSPTEATYQEMGWQAAVSVPLPGPAGPIGTLTFAWKQPYPLDDAERTVLAALAGYVAQALLRADYLFSREQVATLLQQAMLSDLPEAAPFELAARYAPATRGEHVGGDWYDVVRVKDEHFALVVGDVAGHDMRAAGRMGQLRSMLRAYIIDRQEPPSALLRRLDNAMRILDDHFPTTAVLAYVEPDAAGYRLQWANAGHPTPVLIELDGTVTPLTGRDMLLGVRHHTSRNDHTRTLPRGSTVLFYTDGLIETRTDVIDVRKRELHRVLRGLATAPLPDLLDETLTRLAGDNHEDDVALLALRVPR
ncbi:serine phosphatase RsbU (regulator of sigma subunit) [Actinoplanes lutulentus]|uniref:GAF domain-containing protein n=1 Tax=Actinoplanes lutulentus TaxID=1287878 RepID=A0A327ZBD6_9ACTN|nr:SpoIIE family protein phosphatase [Actinoplanes lutulentus]MBB2948816.1 serine phosphatase RsbU (regulator of sigma subunit) [Actinoplanes lutulentus]RAK29728.1 GAF domain-containing protein [Actinoplanes lutulentus]